MKITAEDLFCAINNANDKYIDEAAEEEITPILNPEIYQAAGRNSVLSYASMAAALILIIALAIFIPSLADKPQNAPEVSKISAETEKTVYPTDNIENTEGTLSGITNEQHTGEHNEEIGAPAYAVLSGTAIVDVYKCRYTLSASYRTKIAFIEGFMEVDPTSANTKIVATVEATYLHKENGQTTPVYTTGSAASTAGGIHVSADVYSGGELDSATGTINFTIGNYSSGTLRPGTVIAN